MTFIVATLDLVSKLLSAEVLPAGASFFVEIGDGQVSDLVGWEPARFAELWKV